LKHVELMLTTYLSAQANLYHADLLISSSCAIVNTLAQLKWCSSLLKLLHFLEKYWAA